MSNTLLADCFGLLDFSASDVRTLMRRFQVSLMEAQLPCWLESFNICVTHLVCWLWRILIPPFCPSADPALSLPMQINPVCLRTAVCRSLSPPPPSLPLSLSFSLCFSLSRSFSLPLSPPPLSPPLPSPSSREQALQTPEVTVTLLLFPFRHQGRRRCLFLKPRCHKSSVFGSIHELVSKFTAQRGWFRRGTAGTRRAAACAAMSGRAPSFWAYGTW